MRIVIYETAEEVAPNQRYVARAILPKTGWAHLSMNGGDPDKLAADFRKFIESEIEKARPRKRKSLTKGKPSDPPTSETDVPACEEHNQNISLPGPENRGDDMGVTDEDDLIG